MFDEVLVLLDRLEGAVEEGDDFLGLLGFLDEGFDGGCAVLGPSLVHLFK